MFQKLPRERVAVTGRAGTAAAAALALAVVLAGCGATVRPNVYAQETFGTDSAHSRTFPVAVADTCEAARRSLLSHGYIVTRANADGVAARKSFQPSIDTHVEIEFNVVCASEGSDRATVFVNAVQDRYALKKTSTSASLGVGPVGSVSLPFGSSSDSMVKIASETIPAAEFYDRYFSLIEHFLAQREDEPDVGGDLGVEAEAASQSRGPVGDRPRP